MTTTINKVRTATRRDSRLTKNVVGSLQTCKLDENEDLLTKKSNDIDEHAESPEIMAHRNNLRGLRAILEQLLCITSAGNRNVRFFYIQFDEAFALFLSFQPGLTAESLKYTNQRFSRNYSATQSTDYLFMLSAANTYY